MYGGLWKNFQTPPLSLSSLQDVAEDQSGRRESRLTPSQSGCISVAPPHPPPISSLGRLSRTDDVTDCCEHCFHGNAFHRFGLHFRELSLHSPTPHPPSPLTSHTLRPLLTTQPSHPSSDENRREVGGGWVGGAHCCGQEERHGQKDKNNSEK